MIIFNLWGHDSQMNIVVQGGKYVLLFYDVNSIITNNHFKSGIAKIK